MMKEWKKMKNWKGMGMWGCGGCNSSGAVYGLGFLGALIYFLQRAPSFGDALLGIVKAVLWPGFIIYRVLELLKM